MPFIRIALIVISLVFAVVFALDQYDFVRSTLLFPCISCLGLTG